MPELHGNAPPDQVYSRGALSHPEPADARDTDPGRAPAPGGPPHLAEVFTAALRLGLTSFGGPVAHVGYMHREYVERRKWLGDAEFADLVALTQFLPGPASSQLGMAIGIGRAGHLGGVVAWVGFTLPSAVLMVLFAYGVGALGAGGWLAGLAVAALAVVALAVAAMARRLCPDVPCALLALAAAALVFLVGGALAQVGAILGGGVAGWALLGRSGGGETTTTPGPVRRTHAILALAVFALLLFGLPVAAQFAGSDWLGALSRFYRTGSLVFGGGHVVLPLLEADVVAPGWTTNDRFLAGYGAVQAVPGPLLSIAAYLGAVLRVGPGGPLGAAAALVAIFLPSYLLIVGALPFWGRLRGSPGCQAALRGANAAVVGILLAALIDPVATTAIRGVADVLLAAAALAALAWGRVPPWAVVIACAAAGQWVLP